MTLRVPPCSPGHAAQRIGLLLAMLAATLGCAEEATREVLADIPVAAQAGAKATAPEANETTRGGTAEPPATASAAAVTNAESSATSETETEMEAPVAADKPEVDASTTTAEALEQQMPAGAASADTAMATAAEQVLQAAEKAPAAAEQARIENDAVGAGAEQADTGTVTVAATASTAQTSAPASENGAAATSVAIEQAVDASGVHASEADESGAYESATVSSAQTKPLEASDEAAVTVAAASAVETVAKDWSSLSYEATYQAKIKGLSVSMKRMLEVKGQNAKVSMDIKKMIFRLYESSSMSIDNSGTFRTQYYTHMRKNLGDRHDRELFFDYEEKQVRDKLRPEQAPIGIDSDLYDEISYQEQLRLDFIRAPDKKRFEYVVTDGQWVKTYAFERLDDELIETPMGQMNTVKFKRDRGANSKRETYFWFAIEHNYLLARLDQIEEPGKKAERMQIRSAKIAAPLDLE